MASQLDKALDDVIRENKARRRRNTDIPRRSTGPSGSIRKRVDGSSLASRYGGTFVRTVQLRGSSSFRSRDRGNVNGQWKHDMFEESQRFGERSITSRIGSRIGFGGRPAANAELIVENLHYNVTEKDLQDLFEMVGPVERVRIDFDRSGRSTGSARVRFVRYADAERALEKYNNVELDGQPMRIQMAPERRGGRFGTRSATTGRLGEGRGRRRGGDSRNVEGQGSRRARTVTDLDEEMDAYMKTNTETNTNTAENNGDAMAID